MQRVDGAHCHPVNDIQYYPYSEPSSMQVPAPFPHTPLHPLVRTYDVQRTSSAWMRRTRQHAPFAGNSISYSAREEDGFPDREDPGDLALPDDSWSATGDDTESSAATTRRQRVTRRRGRASSPSTDTSEPARQRQRRSRTSHISVGDESGQRPTIRTRSASSLEAGGVPRATSSDQDTFRNTVAILIEQVRQHDRYGFFCAPVDPEEAPDYHEVIPEPMDLGTMQRKLETGKYRRLDEVERDLDLIWRNCFTYNPTNSIYYREAARMQKWALKRVQWARQRLCGITGAPSPAEGQSFSTSTHSRDEKVQHTHSRMVKGVSRGSAVALDSAPRMTVRLQTERHRDPAAVPGTSSELPTATETEGKPKPVAEMDVVLDEALDPEASYAVAAQDPGAFIERVWRAFVTRQERLRIEKEHERLYHYPRHSSEGERAAADLARTMLSQWLGKTIKRAPNDAEKYLLEILSAAELPAETLQRMATAFTSQQQNGATTAASVEENPSLKSRPTVGRGTDAAASHDDAQTRGASASATDDSPETSKDTFIASRWYALRRSLAALRLAQIQNAPLSEQLRRYDTVLALLARQLETIPPRLLLAEGGVESIRAFAQRLVQYEDSRAEDATPNAESSGQTPMASDPDATQPQKGATDGHSVGHHPAATPGAAHANDGGAQTDRPHDIKVDGVFSAGNATMLRPQV